MCTTKEIHLMEDFVPEIPTKYLKGLYLLYANGDKVSNLYV